MKCRRLTSPKTCKESQQEETQDSRWSNSSSRQAKVDVPAQKQSGKRNSLTGRISLSVRWRPWTDWMRPTFISEKICFTHSTDLNVNLNPKDSQMNTRKNAQLGISKECNWSHSNFIFNVLRNCFLHHVYKEITHEAKALEIRSMSNTHTHTLPSAMLSTCDGKKPTWYCKWPRRKVT